jgi:hypothetical protein
LALVSLLPASLLHTAFPPTGWLSLIAQGIAMVLMTGLLLASAERGLGRSDSHAATLLRAFSRFVTSGPWASWLRTHSRQRSRL